MMASSFSTAEFKNRTHPFLHPCRGYWDKKKLTLNCLFLSTLSSTSKLFKVNEKPLKTRYSFIIESTVTLVSAMLQCSTASSLNHAFVTLLFSGSRNRGFPGYGNYHSAYANASKEIKLHNRLKIKLNLRDFNGLI